MSKSQDSPLQDAPTQRIDDTGAGSLDATQAEPTYAGPGTQPGTGGPPPFPSGGFVPTGSGQMIGRYKIERELGAGAMGRVYLARDPMIDRLVALKTFRQAQEGDLRDRLVDEARKAAAIAHPNVVTVYDVLEQDDGLFIAMEYVPGTSLEARLEEGPLDLHETVEMVAQIASALDHLHLRGIVHRDLKPANILLTREGTVKLADFGIAAATENAADQPADVYGTPQYMAPEQIRGQEIDQRTDIFALGILVHEMLTGTKPFPGATVAEILQSILHEDPDLARIGQVAPNGVVRAIGRALAKRPGRRYPSAGALSRDLWRAASDAPAKRGGVTERFRTRKALVGSALGAALVFVLIVVGLAVRSGRSEDASSDSEARQASAAETYLPLLKEGRRLMEEGDPHAAMVFFSAAERLAPEPARVRLLLEEARQMAERDGVEDLLVEARSALERKRYDEVMATARSLLDSEAGRDEALEVLAEVEQALDRERRAAQRRAQATAAAAASSEPDPTESPEEGEMTVPQPARLAVRLRSDAPRGTLAIYSDQERILSKEFDFYERKLFRKVAQGGVLEAEIALSPGPRTLRILVTRHKEKAEGEQLEVDLVAGELRELAIDLPAEGNSEVVFR